MGKSAIFIVMSLFILAACTPFTVTTERGTLRVERAVPPVTVKPQIAPNELSKMPTVTPSPEVSE